jgi:hypothetical protein
VAATPEEIVRQNLIQQMIRELGFPKGLISVEKGLPPFKRRFDLVCYANRTKGLIPLLLAECKAGSIDEAALQQALGYNDSVGAYFICLAGAKEIRTLWRERGEVKSVPFLPTYAQLVEKIY